MSSYSSGLVWQYPKWYQQYVAEHEPNVVLPGNPYETSDVRHEDDSCGCEPPPKRRRQEDSASVCRDPTIKRLYQYISENGGHSAIETMEIPHELSNWVMLAKLQQSLRNQRVHSNHLVMYPKWYRNYIATCEPNVQLPAPPESEKSPAHRPSRKKPGKKRRDRLYEASDELIDHILRHGGHSALGSIPNDISIEHWEALAKLQKNVNLHRTSGSETLNYPRWYRIYISDHEPDVELPPNQQRPLQQGNPSPDGDPEAWKPRKRISRYLIAYILKNGGHAAIESMPINYYVKDSQALSALQQFIKKQKKRSDPVLNYPRWYRQYIAENEPDVQLPEPTGKAYQLKPGISLIQSTAKFTYEHIVKYITENGGHSAIETMPINAEVKGWEKLYNLQRRLRGHKKIKGGIFDYPNWYRRYVSEHEPSVVLPVLPGSDINNQNPKTEGNSTSPKPPTAAPDQGTPFVQAGGKVEALASDRNSCEGQGVSEAVTTNLDVSGGQAPAPVPTSNSNGCGDQAVTEASVPTFGLVGCAGQAVVAETLALSSDPDASGGQPVLKN